MRLSVIVHVTVLVVGISLSYWAGLGRADSAGSEAAGLAERSRMKVRQNRVHPPEAGPAKRSVAELAGSDPEGAWELLLASGDTQEYARQAGGILRRLAEKDPRRAHELALNLRNADQRVEALGVVLRVWAAKEPKEALTVATSRPETARQALAADLARIWGAGSTSEAASFGAGLPEGPMRRGFLQGLGSIWMGKDTAGFCAWFQGHSPQQSRSLLADIRSSFENQVKSDVPSLDFESLKLLGGKLPSGWDRDFILMHLVNHLRIKGNDDFAGNLAELKTLPDASLSKFLRESLIERYMAENPKLMMAFVDQMEPKEKSRYQGQLVSLLAVQDLEAATGFLESLPKGEERDAAVEYLVSDIKNDHPDLALEVLLKNPGVLQGKGGFDLVQAFLRWTDVEPSEILKVVSLMDKPEDRNSSLREIGKELAFKDLHGSLEWVETLPPGSERDAALKGMLQAVKTQDSWGEPKAKIDWILASKDARGREDALRDGLLEWILREPAGAEAWMKANPSLVSQNNEDYLTAKKRLFQPSGKAK